MTPDLPQAIQEKVPLLPVEQQREVLALVEKLLNEKSSHSIWQRLEERLKEVPPEEMMELPADASENLDYYLYGAAKKQK